MGLGASHCGLKGGTAVRSAEVGSDISHLLDAVAFVCQGARRMAATRPRSTFGDQLRIELAKRDLSVRKLSRLMDPAKPEQARRSLAKWISGKTRPSLASRHLVADTLGIDRATFDDEDDEEESDLYADLIHVMRRVARHEAERVLEEARP